jgi:hypothetical protein
MKTPLGQIPGEVGSETDVNSNYESIIRESKNPAPGNIDPPMGVMSKRGKFSRAKSAVPDKNSPVRSFTRHLSIAKGSQVRASL